MTSQSQAKRNPKVNDNQATLPTFMDHIRELQGRLFSIAIMFLLMACLTYPFFDLIVNFLVVPLGDEHELVYLTPAGAFSFIIKVCMYVGAIGSLPLIIYHLYRFFLPAVKPVNIRRALGYTIISLFLALAGLSFAYFISLPAALYFLTSFDLHHISPMLTIDSYFSFIMTYLLAGALLFQLPLIITIINTIKPLTPGGMMKYQRHLILGSFIIAAIISPTPDALNQTLLAMPVVLMYQSSIVMIWFINRKSHRKVSVRPIESTRSIGKLAVRRSLAKPIATVQTVVSLDRSQQEALKPSASNGSVVRRAVSIDGFGSVNRQVSGRSQTNRSQIRPITRPSQVKPVRGIDGFILSSR